MVDVLGPSAAQHERGDRPRTCVLAVAATSVERDIIRAWFRDHVTTGDPDCVLVDVGAEPSAAASLRSLLEGSLRIEEDVSMTPVRLAWRPVERRGLRRARLWDAVRLRDPYHPRARQQSRVVREAPDRYDLVVAHAATCSELMARYRTSNSGPDDAAGFTQFVGRQCVLALERAETQRYGIRHKLPRLVREEILASRRYSDGVEALSRRLDRPVEAVEAEAAEYLREMVATPSRMIVDVGVQFARLANRRKYGTNPVSYTHLTLPTNREV